MTEPNGAFPDDEDGAVLASLAEAGVDLSKPMSDQVFDEVHRALLEYCVIFFRDQDLDHESHKAGLGRALGKTSDQQTQPHHDKCVGRG